MTRFQILVLQALYELLMFHVLPIRNKYNAESLGKAIMDEVNG